MAGESSDILILHTRLASLTHRERRLLLLRSALLMVGSILGTCLIAVLVVALRLPRAPSVTILLLLSGLALWASWALPLGAWTQAHSAVRQARTVESLRPSLRGRLIAVAERPAGALPGESASILSYAAVKALREIEDLPTSQVHSSRPIRRVAVIVAWLGLALGLGSAVAPAGPISSLRILFFPAQALARASLPKAADDQARALVGDITLRYVYPAYTGLEPLDVPNSTGDVHAPPGTRVEIHARTARVYEAAALSVALNAESRLLSSPQSAEVKSEDLTPTPEQTPVELSGGRDLSASLEVNRDGTWTFLLFHTGEVERSADHTIVVEPDLAPELLVESPSPTLEVAWDQALPLTWTARDDYGLLRVEVVATKGTSSLEPRTLREPLDAPRRVDGDLTSFNPSSLGFHPGDEGFIEVVAWDNDAVLGSKQGRSRAIKILVIGPKGQEARAMKRIRELRDILISMLADFLEEPFPPGVSAQSMLKWSEVLSHRAEPLEDLMDRHWEGLAPDSFEGTVLATVQDSYDALLGFVAALAGTRPQGGPQTNESTISEEDSQNLKVLHSDTVSRLEQGVLALDEIVRMESMARVMELAREVADQASELSKLDKASANELLSRLDRLERELSRLEKAVTDLSASSVQEFVNGRTTDARNLLEEIRKAISEGRLDDARALIDRLAQDLQDLAQSVEETKAAGDEQARKAAEDTQKLQKELKDLEKAERALAQETSRLAEKLGPSIQDAVDQWAELLRRAQELAARLEALSQDLAEDEHRSQGESGWAQRAGGSASSLSGALQARDLQKGIELARETERAVSRLAEVMSWMTELRQSQGQQQADDPVVKAEVADARQESTSIRRELERMTRQQARLSPESLAASQALAEQQEQLRQRTQAAAQQAERLSREFAMRAPGLSEGVKRAEQEMGNASELLKGGKPVEGEGAELAAANHLAEASQALERAMRDREQMQRFMQGQSANRPEGQKQSQKDGEKTDRCAERVEIPVPEEFRTPEAYRRALLEGMSGAVPQEYEALKRRYYEELVKQ